MIGLEACIVRGIIYEEDHTLRRRIFLKTLFGEVAMSGKSILRNA